MPSIVDFSQASSFSQLPDEDFLALMQKFPNGPYDFNSINPQTILNYPLPTLTPPSEDSSPSPPSARDDASTTPHADSDDGPDPALKRKASDEDLEEGPSQKSQHTLANNKKAAASTATRRKSSGNAPAKDETRLLKRKEQNRAAQRAFRERKEKHVKDLEDKVAALEAKNEQAQTENDNLKDLLTRLQTENVILRSATFTFQMPKSSEGAQYSQSPSTDSSLNMLTGPSSPPPPVSPTTASSSHASPKSNFPSSIDWNALTTFDPSMLTALDEPPQQTASDSSMDFDFGFGDNTGSTSNYTTIANNPSFMSFAAMFDSTPTPTVADPTPFTYDMSSVMSTWSPPPSNDSNPLDDLFGGMLTASQQPPVDFNVLMTTSPALSPVSHHNSINGRSPSDSPAASASSPSSSDKPDLSQHQDCPKTKAEIEQAIKASGNSPFAPPSLATGGAVQADSPFAPPASTLRKSADSGLAPMVTCQGSTFPRVEKSDNNIEVLSAWKTIRSNPQFKDIDINDLCSEFTSKARCDGTKVVLEPQGVHNILESLKAKTH